MNTKPCLLLALLTALPSIVTAQAKPSPSPSPGATPSFPTQVELVVVDAVVKDKKGTPVTDLKQADFTVLEDGQVVVRGAGLAVAPEAQAQRQLEDVGVRRRTHEPERPPAGTCLLEQRLDGSDDVRPHERPAQPPSLLRPRAQQFDKGQSVCQ